MWEKYKVSFHRQFKRYIYLVKMAQTFTGPGTGTEFDTELKFLDSLFLCISALSD